MNFSYTVTLADYKAAMKLHRRQSISRRIAGIFWFRIMPVFGFFVLAWDLYSGFMLPGGFARNPAFLMIVPLAFMLVPAIWSYLLGRQFDQLFSSQTRSLNLDLDDERIVCMNPGRSEGKFMWNAVVGFAQDERVTLLYVAKLRFVFFPTQAMSPTQRAELYDLVARHVPGTKP